MEKVYLMQKDLVIHKNAKGVQIALLEDNKLVEYHLDGNEATFNTGNIYIGRVKRINPGIKAAFVDVGHAKEAFIHYTDLNPNLRSILKYTNNAIKEPQDATLNKFSKEPLIEKNGLIEDVLKKGDIILTQIMKEPISTKGPRLSSEISIPGRYIVLTPFGNSVGVSKKIIDKDERKRLQTILESLRPQNFGIVARTNAQNKNSDELHKDIANLMKKWELLTQNMLKAKAPKLLMSEIEKSLTIIRDVMNDTFNSISTDDKDLYDDIKEYIARVAPKKENIVKHHISKKPLFEVYGVNRQIKSAFGKAVTLKSGAYLVIEHTEALHVIDVNSGPKINRTDDQDTNAFNVNKEAAIEIARQLRLRNIGGIIVIDFIDLKSNTFRSELYRTMQEAMKTDKAKYSILPLSKFGLMEITRQRSSAELTIDTTEKAVAGNGRMENCLLIVENIRRDLDALMVDKKAKIIYVHPFVEAYLKLGFKSIQRMWSWKYKVWIKVLADSSNDLMEYNICDQNGALL
jgi:ribonuclease G